MRHDFQITITNARRAWHFSLDRSARKRAAMLGAAVSGLLVAMMASVVLLSARVGHLDEELAETRDRATEFERANQRLLAHRGSLERRLADNIAAMRALDADLRQIETMLDLAPATRLPVAGRVHAARQTALERRLLLQSVPSGAPLVEAVVTSGFGMREHPLVEKTRLHGGIDLRAGVGTEVRATADGVVADAGANRETGMGRMIRVVHNYGFETVYAHLSELDVERGQYIRRGEVLGRSGNTGLSDAPHLHYEVRYLGRRLDPKPFMNWSLERFDTIFEHQERVQWQSLTANLRGKIQVMEPRLSPPAPSLSATSP